MNTLCTYAHIHTHAQKHTCTHTHYLPQWQRFRTTRMVSSLSAAWWKSNPRNIPFHVPCKTHLPPGGTVSLLWMCVCVRVTCVVVQRQEDQNQNFLISFCNSNISQESTTELHWCRSFSGNINSREPDRQNDKDDSVWEIKGVWSCRVRMRQEGTIRK